MRSFTVFVCLLLAVSIGFGQGDRGTVTGTVADPTGAAIANAPIEAKNKDTGAVYPTVSTSTGNYTLSQLPAGNYELTASAPGFKKFVHESVIVQVAQVVRVDIGLQLGQTSDTVTVSAESTLLKTESGEMSHNVTSERLDNLPILGIGGAAAGSAGIRNPLAATILIPGVIWQANANVKVNGAPSNTEVMRLDGQDATNGYSIYTPMMTQPSVDSLAEISIQTSNFAAEYGTVGGGLYNMTTKSGSNQFHGSGYDYFVNEAFNAAQPFTSVNGQPNVRARARRNDYGFTFGGPVWIPKIYNGHDKTFFFVNWEQFRETQRAISPQTTVPTAAFRNGDFSSILGIQRGVDPLGRPIYENQIFDPTTERPISATDTRLIRDAFPGNKIPSSYFDPVAVKIQNLIPLPNNGGLTNNFIPNYPSQRVTTIPAVKADHSFSSKMKLAFYWSKTGTESALSNQYGQAEGFPDPITAARGTYVNSHTERLNLDYTLAPTVLLHMGAGFQHLDFQDHANVLNYDAATQLGLKGATLNRNFPTFATMATGFGGMAAMGPINQNHSRTIQPTGNASVSWIHGNHSYKFGGELRVEGELNTSYTNTNGNYTFNAAQTAQPYVGSTTVGGGTIGFPYASFLLGRVNNGNIGSVSDVRRGKTQTGLFAQDTWKITRKFTLDYGLRWDYSTYLKEQYGRYSSFDPLLPNPSAGNHPGASIFEGFGPGRCNCDFAKNYPFAFGPRLGFAYQMTPKTVLRGGFGIVYNGTGNENMFSVLNPPSQNPFQASSFGQPGMLLSTGIPVPASQLVWPKFDPGVYPAIKGVPSALPLPQYDQNAGRPARQYQWSFGVQREIFRNLVVEASYVGNRGVWWRADSLINVNALTPQILAQYGIDINNASDRTLLTSPINSPAAIAKGLSLPYSNFPPSTLVNQALRPFPQFTTINRTFAPLGKTWYDSLQAKATQRLSHGLDFTYVFTWQKELVLGSDAEIVGPGSVGTGSQVNDVFNRDQNKYISSFSRPLVSVLGLNYTVPRWRGNKVLSYIGSDWQFNTALQYASGLPIRVPNSNNNLANQLFRGTFANRVPGVPLFLKDPNCGCIDPNKDFVLNPAAWVDPPAGQFSSSAAYYNDYRYQRRPSEDVGVARNFKFGEGGRYNFQVRMEMHNVLNRTYLNNPVATTFSGPQTFVTNTTTGVQTPSANGFGYINPGSTQSQPRNGVLVGRFTF